MQSKRVAGGRGPTQERRDPPCYLFLFIVRPEEAQCKIEKPLDWTTETF